MRLRDLFGGDAQRQPAPANGGTPAEGELDRLRRDAEDLLAAGDAAIERALSGNSQAFLHANRQQGGQ